MKKLLLISFLLLLSPVFAITWEKLTTPMGAVVYLDTDSITQNDGYYFYNIKFKTSGRKNYTVMTIQSSHSRPFSARIQSYSEAQYDELKGDYENITKNETAQLEPVTYQSTVHTCYKRVRNIIETSKNSKITF